MKSETKIDSVKELQNSVTHRKSVMRVSDPKIASSIEDNDNPTVVQDILDGTQSELLVGDRRKTIRRPQIVMSEALKASLRRHKS